MSRRGLVAGEGALAALATVGALAACKALPPPPVVAFHGDTAAAAPDTTTAMVVVGVVGEVLSDDAWGVALRVEHQQTRRTTAGVELTGGWGPATDDGRHWLLGVRGYGRFTPRDHDVVALGYGGGLSVMDVGLVTLTGHVGGAVSYPNDHVAPFLQLGTAFAVPLRRGRSWGDEQVQICLVCERGSTTTDPPEPVRADLYLTVDGGAVGLLGDTGNRLSLDLGFAAPLRADELLVAVSIAEHSADRRLEPRYASTCFFCACSRVARKRSAGQSLTARCSCQSLRARNTVAPS